MKIRQGWHNKQYVFRTRFSISENVLYDQRVNQKPYSDVNLLHFSFWKSWIRSWEKEENQTIKTKNNDV